MTKKLDTAPYKGVRDFYPEDMRVLNWMFERMRKTAESFGYVEYTASPLEPAELYQAKSGEEIVNDQTYTFTDRGDRSVTLRPEMTPTVARMVAGKRRDLGFPLRWFSIPNVFRYENPQRGRLREHYQLNVDLFGIPQLEGDVEIITVAAKIMESFGAKSSDFQILVNSRLVLNGLYKHLSIPEEKQHALAKVIDKKNKIAPQVYEESIQELVGEKSTELISLLNSNKKLVETLGENDLSVKNLISLIERLSVRGVTNVVFTPTLMRGFDYYTDIVFEIVDTDPQNTRSLFGGGRYDNLTELFNEDKVPAVGFGMGDVTLRDFLETHKLLPDLMSEVDVTIGTSTEDLWTDIEELSMILRNQRVNVSEYGIARHPADFFKFSERNKIRFLIHLEKDFKDQANCTLKFTFRDQGGEKAFSGVLENKGKELADYIKQFKK